jgi:hypothetical protein
MAMTCLTSAYGNWDLKTTGRYAHELPNERRRIPQLKTRSLTLHRLGIGLEASAVQPRPRSRAHRYRGPRSGSRDYVCI